MKDLTAAVPWAKSVIRNISLLFLIYSCSSTKNQIKNDLLREEYDVINAYFGSIESPTKIYYRTSKDNDWGKYINIDIMISEECFPVYGLSKKELEDMFPAPLIDEFKKEVKRLKSFKLQESGLKKEIMPVKTLVQADYKNISKPIIIGDIAILRRAFGKRKNEIRITILEKKNNMWVNRYTYCERLMLY